MSLVCLRSVKLKATVNDIVQVVGFDLADSWSLYKPDVYMKDGIAYGLIAEEKHGLITFIIASVQNPSEPFTVGMLKRVIHLIRTTDVCVITDHRDYIESMKKSLSRIGKFDFRYNENGVLFSYNIRGENE